MCSVYFSGESGDRASSRRSSCLRSSNRSVRKSFPSQVNKSNAKKHGGFPRRNSRFLNCGLPRLSREQISPSIWSRSVCGAGDVNGKEGSYLRDSPLHSFPYIQRFEPFLYKHSFLSRSEGVRSIKE